MKSLSAKMFTSLVLLACFIVSSVSNAESVDLSAYKGKVVYVDFWASWCEPCKDSFPWLNGLESKFGPKDFVVLGVNLDKEKADTDKFLTAIPAKFKIVYDPKGESAEKYGVEGMPYAVIFDKEGKIIHKHIGFTKEKIKGYEDQIREALKK